MLIQHARSAACSVSAGVPVADARALDSGSSTHPRWSMSPNGIKVGEDRRW